MRSLMYISVNHLPRGTSTTAPGGSVTSRDKHLAINIILFKIHLSLLLI